MKALTHTQWVSVVFLLTVMLAILLVAGCSGSSETQQAVKDQQQNEELKQEVDELKRQKEQEELQQQIDELKEAQEQQGQEPPDIVVGTSAPEGRVVLSPNATYAGTTQEAAALGAATAYYEAAERGDYSYTYNALVRLDQRRYSYAEWVNANEQLDSAAGEFVIFSVEETPGNADNVRVGLTVYTTDGGSFDRYTDFTYERGAWRHSLTGEEYRMFDSVL